ncbi:putative dual specificity protein kinase shkB-like [Sesbania bispinosa]|nr:putative dual specificity protein kinase shkB-like [Sesbania bispinosa]
MLLSKKLGDKTRGEAEKEQGFVSTKLKAVQRGERRERSKRDPPGKESNP